MMIINILAFLLATVGLVFYLRRYRAEGIGALYLNGLHTFFLLTEIAGLSPSTLMTGMYSALTGAAACLLWFFHRPSETETELPRRGFSYPWMAFFLLWLLWFAHHMIERPTGTVLWKAEYYKWAYSIVRWMLPLFAGLLLPMSAERVQRFLRATAVLGLVTCSLMIVAYASGLADIGRYPGYRYGISERGGSGYAAAAAIGTGALLGGYLICQERLTTRRIVFVVSGVLIFFSAVVLSGTRSTLLIMPLAVLAALGFFRIRYLVLGLVGGALVGLLAVSVVVPLLPPMAVKRAMSLPSIMEGIRLRTYLAMETFNILKVSPVIGKTVRLQEIIGITYSHNFTLQVLVETGLLGWALYLSAVGAVAFKWLRMIVNRRSLLFPIGGPLFLLFLVCILEAHAHGSIMNSSVWLCYGIMAGHGIHGFQGEQAGEEWPEEWPEEIEAAWAPVS